MGDEFTEAEKAFLIEAAQFFENPGLFAKSLNWVGIPIEYAQRKLPDRVRITVAKASKVAIEKALIASIKTVPKYFDIQSFADATSTSKRTGIIHTTAASVVGGVGGFFGLAALPVELPLATVIVLRSIAEIAQNYGNDLSTNEVRLECLYVFSLGSKSDKDDAMDSAYYGSRIAFAELLKRASAYLGGVTAAQLMSAIEGKSTPVLVRLISEVAAQFEIRVTNKILVQSTPVLGALGGVGINMMFTNFFHTCAKYHFGMKRLEEDRGFEVVRLAFEDARRKCR